MPDRYNKRPGSRPEFEVAWYTKELGKSLQREMLQKQLALLSVETTAARGGHGEDAAPQAEPPPPPEDRAG